VISRCILNNSNTHRASEDGADESHGEIDLSITADGPSACSDDSDFETTEHGKKGYVQGEENNAMADDSIEMQRSSAGDENASLDCDRAVSTTPKPDVAPLTSTPKGGRVQPHSTAAAELQLCRLRDNSSARVLQQHSSAMPHELAELQSPSYVIMKASSTASASSSVHQAHAHRRTDPAEQHPVCTATEPSRARQSDGRSRELTLLNAKLEALTEKNRDLHAELVAAKQENAELMTERDTLSVAVTDSDAKIQSALKLQREAHKQLKLAQVKHAEQATLIESLQAKLNDKVEKPRYAQKLATGNESRLLPTFKISTDARQSVGTLNTARLSQKTAVSVDAKPGESDHQLRAAAADCSSMRWNISDLVTRPHLYWLTLIFPGGQHEALGTVVAARAQSKGSSRDQVGRIVPERGNTLSVERDASAISADEDGDDAVSFELAKREARVVDARLALDRAHKKVSKCRDIHARSTGKIEVRRQAAVRLKCAEEEVISARSERNEAERQLTELKPAKSQTQSAIEKRTKQMSLTGEIIEGKKREDTETIEAFSLLFPFVTHHPIQT
jgi:hypothetical protein